MLLSAPTPVLYPTPTPVLYPSPDHKPLLHPHLKLCTPVPLRPPVPPPASGSMFSQAITLNLDKLVKRVEKRKMTVAQVQGRGA